MSSNSAKFQSLLSILSAALEADGIDFDNPAWDEYCQEVDECGTTMFERACMELGDP